MRWIRTSRLSIKNSLSLPWSHCFRGQQVWKPLYRSPAEHIFYSLFHHRKEFESGVKLPRFFCRPKPVRFEWLLRFECFKTFQNQSNSLALHQSHLGKPWKTLRQYRGTSLWRNQAPLGPYNRTMPGPYNSPRGGAFSYEPGTPVSKTCQKDRVQYLCCEP